MAPISKLALIASLTVSAYAAALPQQSETNSLATAAPTGEPFGQGPSGSQPQHGGPQHGGPQNGGPQNGGPQHGGAQHGGAQHGGAQHGGAQEGGPKHGGAHGKPPGGKGPMHTPGVGSKPHHHPHKSGSHKSAGGDATTDGASMPTSVAAHGHSSAKARHTSDDSGSASVTTDLGTSPTDDPTSSVSDSEFDNDKREEPLETSSTRSHETTSTRSESKKHHTKTESDATSTTHHATKKHHTKTALGENTSTGLDPEPTHSHKPKKSCRRKHHHSSTKGEHHHTSTEGEHRHTSTEGEHRHTSTEGEHHHSSTETKKHHSSTATLTTTHHARDVIETLIASSSSTHSKKHHNHKSTSEDDCEPETTQHKHHHHHTATTTDGNGSPTHTPGASHKHHRSSSDQATTTVAASHKHHTTSSSDGEPTSTSASHSRKHETTSKADGTEQTSTTSTNGAATPALDSRSEPTVSHSSDYGVQGPVISNDFADASLIKVDGTWYSFASANHVHVQMASSTDFKKWTYSSKDAMPDVSSAKWIEGQDHDGISQPSGPDVIRTPSGKYVMQFSAPGSANKGDRCLGTAIANEVEGPYEPQSQAFLCGTKSGESLDDPSFFTEDNGALWLLYKSGYGTGSDYESSVMMQQLSNSDSDYGLKTESKQQPLTLLSNQHGQNISSPYMSNRNGAFFLTYTVTDESSSSSSIEYAVSSKLTSGFKTASKPLLANGDFHNLDNPCSLSVERGDDRAVINNCPSSSSSSSSSSHGSSSKGHGSSKRHESSDDSTVDLWTGVINFDKDSMSFSK